MSGFIPDTSRQTVSDKPVGQVFRAVTTELDNENQGNASGETDHFEERETRGRRERVPREVSGATSARSGSVSRSRDRSAAAPGDVYTETPAQGTNEARNASLSPTRAMGARSVSIDRNRSGDTRMRTRLDTLEGIGSSMSPVATHDALSGGTGSRGRSSSRQRTEDNALGRVSSLSPNRAAGARSTVQQSTVPEEQQ